MTHTEFCTAIAKVIAEKYKMSLKDAKEPVEIVLDTLFDTLASGDGVRIVGLGTFSIVERPERECRNPKTGEKFIAPASKSIKFKASKKLKDALNE